MPELPEIVVYIEALKARIQGRPLRKIGLRSPFFLRTVEPPLDVLQDAVVQDVRRLGKRIVYVFEHDLYVVLHLMIAGRLRWRDVQQALGMSPKMVLATLEFDHGTVIVSEAGSKKRASMHLVRGAGALADMDPGGIEPLEASVEALARVLTAANHTLKRALTDPHLVSGVGNAFSDEILHAARLSPLRLTRTLGHDEIERLWIATRETLTRWADRLRQEAAGAFPEKVTAFHGAMAVHGRFRQPCPACGSPVQRIVYAENECNYCATCQTGGRLLADRSLSRLLKDDWPRRIE